MKYQRQPTCFGPSQHSKKKPPGPRMMKIFKEVQRSQTYMDVSALSRNICANRRDDIENIGCARNVKTYDSSKSGLANRGQDDVVVKKPCRLLLGDNLAMSNGNIFPLGKSKKIAVLESSKSVPSSFRVDSEMVAIQSLKDNSRDANRILKKPPHSSKVVASSRVSSVKASLLLNKVMVVASIHGNDIGGGAHFVDEHEKERSFKDKEDNNSSSRSKCVDIRDNSNVHQRIETLCMIDNMKQNKGSMIKDSSSYNDQFRSKSEELLEELPEEHDYGIEETKTVKLGKRRRQYNEDDDDISGDDPNIVGVDVLTTQTTIVQQTVLLPVLPEEYDNGTEETKMVKPMKRRRRYICNEDDDDTSGDDQNIVGVEGDANMLTTQTAIMEQYGSLPVDEPSWSGMLKIGSEGLVSLEAHLLAKSCEKVWECSRCLENVVQVTKLSRLEVEPKSFKVSRPTEDNIGLYFFPQGMRPNEEFDKLVQEVMVNDLILRAYVNEAEMLILPSILLPERHQTFQGKHYLWGLFKRREDKVNVEGGKQMHGTHLSGHEKENGKQLCSRPGIGKQDIDKEGNALARPAERAAAEAATPAPAAAAATSPALSLPAERAAAGVVTPTPAAASSNAASSPHPDEPAAAEATTPAPAATTTTSHAPISAVAPGGMYGFIVRPNPRIQQLIQEMEREGAVVFTMRGEAIGYGMAGH